MSLTRTLIVAGAAVAALSLAACNKPVEATNNTTETTTENAVAPADNTANAVAPADNAMAPAANTAS